MKTFLIVLIVICATVSLTGGLVLAFMESAGFGFGVLAIITIILLGVYGVAYG